MNQNIKIGSESERKMTNYQMNQQKDNYSK